MIARAFHGWERRLASAATDRVARPFDWGLDWLAIPAAGEVRGPAPSKHWGDAVAATATPSTQSPCDDYPLTGDPLTFSSAMTTPHPENNLVRARFFPERVSAPDADAPCWSLPQWNADAGGHVGLCRLLNRSGITRCV